MGQPPNIRCPSCGAGPPHAALMADGRIYCHREEKATGGPSAPAVPITAEVSPANGAPPKTAQDRGSFCPQCGEPTGASARYCPHCGSEQIGVAPTEGSRQRSSALVARWSPEPA